MAIHKTSSSKRKKNSIVQAILKPFLYNPFHPDRIFALLGPALAEQSRLRRKYHNLSYQHQLGARSQDRSPSNQPTVGSGQDKYGATQPESERSTPLNSEYSVTTSGHNMGSYPDPAYIGYGRPSHAPRPGPSLQHHVVTPVNQPSHQFQPQRSTRSFAQAGYKENIETTRSHVWNQKLLDVAYARNVVHHKMAREYREEIQDATDSELKLLERLVKNRTSPGIVAAAEARIKAIIREDLPATWERARQMAWDDINRSNVITLGEGPYLRADGRRKMERKDGFVDAPSAQPRT